MCNNNTFNIKIDGKQMCMRGHKCNTFKIYDFLRQHNNNSMILTSVLQNQKLITKQLVKPLHKYVLGGYWRTKNACYRLCALN